ncbi:MULTISPECIES: hypothetical protein [Bacillus]|uniref:hypothetical protein n=1 Tax=Bacillus TaxID=1386 RepID=UPI000301899D|nr:MULTISPECIES: hypothetical protein [Bacillus]
MSEVKEWLDRMFSEFPDEQLTEEKKKKIEAELNQFFIKQKFKETKIQNRKRYIRKLNLGYSVCGSILIILMFVFMNFYYSPQTIWFVYPTFAVLWWPLTMLFLYLRA